MRITYTFTEQVWRYDPRDKKDFVEKRAPWLVLEPAHRLSFARLDPSLLKHGIYQLDSTTPFSDFRPNGFTKVRFVADQGGQCDGIWQERYKLAIDVAANSPRKKATDEIYCYLGDRTRRRLRAINDHYKIIFAHLAPPSLRSEVKFKDPDVITLKGGSLQLLELKSVGEEYRYLQRESLTILHYLVEPQHHVGVVRTVPIGVPYTPLTVTHSIDLDDSLFDSLFRDE